MTIWHYKGTQVYIIKMPTTKFFVSIIRALQISITSFTALIALQGPGAAGKITILTVI